MYKWLFLLLKVLMNYCLSVCFIRLCWLIEAQTCEGFREPTKGLIKRT